MTARANPAGILLAIVGVLGFSFKAVLVKLIWRMFRARVFGDRRASTIPLDTC